MIDAADDPPTPQEAANWQRYTSAMHGVQSAVKFEMESTPGYSAASPKHLRVGIDSSFVQTDALVRLLVKKGVFTRDEWFAELADAAERELTMREMQACKSTGLSISFR